MAEAVLELDISPALAALDDLSTAFDDIAGAFSNAIGAALADLPAQFSSVLDELPANFQTSLGTAITDTLGPQLDDIGAQFADVAAGMGEALDSSIGASSGAASGLDGLSNSLDGVGTASSESAKGMDISNASAAALESTSSVLAGSSKTLIATVLPGVAVFGGVAAAIGGLVERADSAALAHHRLMTTFGDSAPQVLHTTLDGLNLTLGELLQKSGSSVSAFEGVAATFGRTAIAAGETTHGAATTTTAIGELTAILTTLNPTLGTADQQFQLVARGLGGSTRILQRYGITIDQVALAHDALALAQEHGRDKASTYDKQVAGSALALKALEDQARKSGTTLQKELADGLDQPTIKFRAFKLEIEDTLVKIGTPLIGPILNLVSSLTPVMTQLITSFGGLLTDAIPAIVSLIQMLSPLGGVLSTVVDILSNIPGPIIAAVGAFILFKDAIGGIGSLLTALPGVLRVVGSAFGVDLGNAVVGAGGQLDLFGGKATRFGGAISATTGFLKEHVAQLAVGAAATLLAIQSFDGIGKSAEGSAIGIGSLMVAGASLGSMFGPWGTAAGVAAGGLIGLGKAIFGGSDAAKVAAPNFEKLGSALEKLDPSEAFSKLETALQNNADAAVRWDLVWSESSGKFGVTAGKFNQAGTELQLTGNHMEKALKSLAETSPGAAQAVLDGAIKMTHGATVFGAAHVITTEQLRSFNAAIEVGAKKYQENADAAAAATAINAQYAASVATDEAAMKTMFASIDNAGQSMKDFVGAAQAGLPTAASAFQDASKAAEGFGVALSPEALLSGLQGSLKGILQWNADLNTIFTEGSHNVVTLLASQGEKAGGDMAHNLAEGIRAGRPGVVDELNTTIGATDAAGKVFGENAALWGKSAADGMLVEFAKFSPALRKMMALIPDIIGEQTPTAAAKAKFFASRLTAEFHAGVSKLPDDVEAAIAAIWPKLDGAQSEAAAHAQALALLGLKDPFLAAMEDLKTRVGDYIASQIPAAVTDSTPPVEAAATESGRRMVNSWGTAIGLMPPTTTAVLVNTNQAVIASSPFFGGSGHAVGEAAHAGVKTGLTPLPASVASFFSTATGVIGEHATAANTGGTKVGAGAVAGFKAGIEPLPAAGTTAVSELGEKLDAAGATVAENVARAAGYGIGQAMGIGIQTGLSDQDTAISQVARDLVDHAKAAAKAEAKAKSPSEVFAEIGANMGQGLALGMRKTADTVSMAGAHLASVAAGGAQGALGSVRSAGGSAASSGGGTTYEFNVNVSGATPENAEQIGASVVTGAQRTLQISRVVTDARAI